MSDHPPVLTRAEAAALESGIADRLPADARARLDALGLLDDTAATAAAVAEAARSRAIEWGLQRLTQGTLLDAFAVHCADELEDVEVVELGPALLVACWRGETSRLRLRNGFADLPRLASDVPTMLIGDLEDDRAAAIVALLDDAQLRTRICLLDPDRLEKVGIVRSSVFVYLEWFLRDAYSVKVLPAPEFTQGLIDRGVISLGMG